MSKIIISEHTRDAMTPAIAIMEAHARTLAGDRVPEHLQGLPDVEKRSLYYPFLYHLARVLEPSRIVEVGVYMGVSLAHLAAGAPATCQVMGVDNNPTQIIDQTMIKHLVYYGDALEDADYVAENCGSGLPIDLLFLDATKSPAEWEAWRPYLAQDAVVCVDDRIAEAWELWESIDTPAKFALDDLHTVPNIGKPVTGFGAFVWSGDNGNAATR